MKKSPGELGINPPGDYDDPFAPPCVPVLVRCLHCDFVYMSSEMAYGKRFHSHDSIWWCKNKTCDGGGFGFDIFPILQQENMSQGVIA